MEQPNQCNREDAKKFNLATDGAPMNTDKKQFDFEFIGVHRCPIGG